MNIADVVIIIIFCINILNGYKRGLIRSVFSFLSLAISLSIANGVYPYVNTFFRENNIVYDFLAEFTRNNLNLSQLMGVETTKAQIDLINGLELPGFLIEQLLTNNNPELYKLFNVTKVEDYIVGYITNYIMSTLIWAVVFLITYLIMKMISRSLNVFAKLPVISVVNRFGGAALSLVVSVVFLWVCFTILTLFFLKPEYMWIFDTIKGSTIAEPIYNSNIILNLISKINI